MILRAAIALVVAPIALLWLLLAVAFSGIFDDAGARLLFDGETYGSCSGDAADLLILPVAVLGVAAVVGAFALRRFRRRLAAAAVVLFVAWVGIWAAGGCGMGSDDEGEFDSGMISPALPIELPASPSHPSTPRTPPSPRATG